MKLIVIIILAVIIALVITFFQMNAKMKKQLVDRLKPFVLPEGSDRPYFESDGVKYDEEKYAEYLRDYTSKMSFQQMDAFLAQRAGRTDIWNVKVCDAIRDEQAKRNAEGYYSDADYEDDEEEEYQDVDFEEVEDDEDGEYEDEETDEEDSENSAEKDKD